MCIYVHTYACIHTYINTYAPLAGRVSFWAVGIDCCGWRGDFRCNDAGVEGAIDLSRCICSCIGIYIYIYTYIHTHTHTLLLQFIICSCMCL